MKDEMSPTKIKNNRGLGLYRAQARIVRARASTCSSASTRDTRSLFRRTLFIPYLSSFISHLISRRLSLISLHLSSFISPSLISNYSSLTIIVDTRSRSSCSSLLAPPFSLVFVSAPLLSSYHRISRLSSHLSSSLIS